MGIGASWWEVLTIYIDEHLLLGSCVYIRGEAYISPYFHQDILLHLRDFHHYFMPQNGNFAKYSYYKSKLL